MRAVLWQWRPPLAGTGGYSLALTIAGRTPIPPGEPAWIGQSRARAFCDGHRRDFMDDVGAVGLLLGLVLFVAWFISRAIGTKIQSPTLGILNLKGADAEGAVSDDRDALSSMFSATKESVDTPPTCDVLLLYCDIEPDGRIRFASGVTFDAGAWKGRAISSVAK